MSLPGMPLRSAFSWANTLSSKSRVSLKTGNRSATREVINTKGLETPLTETFQRLPERVSASQYQVHSSSGETDHLAAREAYQPFTSKHAIRGLTQEQEQQTQANDEPESPPEEKIEGDGKRCHSTPQTGGRDG